VAADVLALAPPLSALPADQGYDGDDLRGEVVRRGDGTGEISSLTAEEIGKCLLNGSLREQIMIFGELLALVNGKVPLLIGFKHRDRNPCPSVHAACLQLARYDGKVAVQSFNRFVIEYLNHAFPGLRVGC
jgi:glycerophosphoryl diester phosphodiesterase